jgi:SAM-dependent methyltransferase
MITAKIEVLPVSLLNEQRATVNELKHLAGSLRLEFGWHYLLDLSWIIANLGGVAGKRIIDAGAGTGIMQWYLAEHGAAVISVDRLSRADLPLRFRRRFHVSGLRGNGDLIPTRKLLRKMLRNPRSGMVAANDTLSLLNTVPASGEVIIYNQDLRGLVDLPDGSLDAVVAVSALEHNSPENLDLVVAELMRVIKPGGMLLATLCAAAREDYYHHASSGWCYTEASLRRIFRLDDGTPSNYDQFDRLLSDLRGCAELRDNLAAFYFKSGDNGMPWGKWDPQYLPVGVCKIKEL